MCFEIQALKKVGKAQNKIHFYFFISLKLLQQWERGSENEVFSLNRPNDKSSIYVSARSRYFSVSNIQ